MLASYMEDTTMDSDAEIPVDHQQLKDLIRKETSAMDKKMIDTAVEAKLKAMKVPVLKKCE
jgi:hypothetical protein